MQNPNSIDTSGYSESPRPANGWRKFALLLLFAVIVFILAVSGKAYLSLHPTQEAEATGQTESTSEQSLQFTDADGQVKEIHPPSVVVTPTIQSSAQAKAEITPEISAQSDRWDGTEKHCEQLGGTYNRAERSCHY